MSPILTIIEDTREQTPLDFSGFRGVDVVRQGLKTGDYSVQGYEDRICFERKSIPDLVGTLIGGHERFLREVERMKAYDEKYILVERDAETLHKYCENRGWEYKFNTIIQSLLGYAKHCQIGVRFCKDRHDMAQYIVSKAREYIREKGENDAIKNENSQDILHVAP